MIVHLIGPGGAGKTTTGLILARELGCSFFDLDEEYLKTGPIEDDIQKLGYEVYVQRNIDLYLKIMASTSNAVIATSSGFMTYSDALHPEINRIQKDILSSPGTVLLLPSFDLDDCVKLTVNRQLSRPHTNSSKNNHQKIILERFPIYSTMGTIKVHTDRSVNHVVDEIMNKMKPQIRKDVVSDVPV